MYNKFNLLAQSQVFNTVGQNNCIAGSVLGDGNATESLQVMLGAGNLTPGADEENGVLPELQSLSGTVILDTDLTAVAEGEIYLVAAEGIAQRTQGYGPGNSIGDLFDGIFTNKIGFQKIGKLLFHSDSSGRMVYRGKFFHRFSKKAKANRVNTTQPVDAFSLYVVGIIWFNQPGLGVGRSGNWNTLYNFKYQLNRQLMHI